VIIAPAATQPDLSGRTSVAKLTIAGSGARLTLNNAHLTVRGDFTTGPNGGAVVMQNPADTLQVDGAAVFSGDDTIGLLTDGALLVGGSFHQQYIGSNWAGFAPSGAHRTVLIGSGPQTLRFDSPAGAPGQRSFFNHLRVDKPTETVWMSSNVVVMGRLELASSAVLRDLETHLTVHDSLVTSSGTEIRIDGWLHLGGGMDVRGGFTATTTDFFGADQAIQPGLPYSNVDVSGRARFVGPTTIDGALHVGNRRDASGAVIRGDIALNEQTVTVAHDLATLPDGGTVTMTSPADTLRVLGNAWFAGSDTYSTLTHGVLSIGGDFRQQYIGSNWASFAPSGGHRTILAGASPQSVLFDSPDGAPTQRSHFHHLSVTNPSTVSLAGRTYVSGDFALSSSGSLDGAATLIVLGALSTSSGSNLRPARVDVAGAVAIAGTFAADTIEYRGTTQTVQAGLPYRHVIVGGTAQLGGATTASGSVVVRSWTPGVPSDLDLAGQQLSVAGDFRTGPNGGSLTMRSASDLLVIGGNATFSGGDTGGQLTAGEIRLAGNFRQQYIGSNWASFAPSGTHRTVLDGSAPQAVHFDSPDGAPTQRSFFQDLVLSGTGGITLASRAYVDGVLRVTAPTAPVIAGNGFDFIAAGVDVPRLTLDNTPFSIGAGPITRFDSVTFQGYSSSATQLTVRHPGAATAFDFVGLRFLVTPTTGWYASARDIAPSNGLPLTINLVGAQATDGPAHTQTLDGAVVHWPVTTAASPALAAPPPVRVANP
jgi:hypothetical protein